MRCPNCGNEIPDGSVMCNNCGNSFNNNSMSFGMNNGGVTPNQNMNNAMYSNSNINNNMNDNGHNSNNKMLIIIIAVLCVIGLGVGIYFITKPSKNTGEVDIEKEIKEQQEKEAKELETQIGTQYTKLKNGDYLIIIDNNSSKDIMADGVVEFYDDSKSVYSQEVYANSYIAPNSKGYAIVRGSRLEGVKYNKVVPKIEAGYYYFKSYGDKITHTEEQKDDHLLITTVNNSGITLEDIVVSVLYYDVNNNIIGFEDELIADNLTAGATNYVEVDYPTDEDYNEISFSRYEVMITASGKN